MIRAIIIISIHINVVKYLYKCAGISVRACAHLLLKLVRFIEQFAAVECMIKTYSPVKRARG